MSIYLQCDGCDAVVDRRLKGDDRNGGTFHPLDRTGLKELAVSLGWSVADPAAIASDIDYCPACKKGGPVPICKAMIC